MFFGVPGFHGGDFPLGVPEGEVHPALFVDVGDFHPHHVADVHHVLHLFHPALSQLGDVDHAVLAGGQFHKGAEVQDANHFAVVQHSHLGDKDDGVNHFLGRVTAGGIFRGDIDGTVVLNVDLGAGLSGDLLDHLAAGADDFPDLIGVNLHGEHLGGVLADLGPGSGDAGEHDLVQNGLPGVAGDVQSLLDDGVGEAVVLNIHLDGGDPVLGAGHLEVHLAVEVLHALDVDEGGEGPVVVLDQAAGDAGHRGLDGHTRVHEGQGGAADGALGGGAVGGNHLRDHPDGVGELLHRGDHRVQSPFRQGAVALFPAVDAAGAPGLTHGVGGEVVVVHIAFFLFLPDGVQLLAGGEGVQGCHGQDLGLPPGEEGRAVDPGQHAHLSGQGTDLVLLTAIHPVPLEEPGFDNLLLEFIGDLFQVLIHLGILLQEEFVPVVDEGVPALLPDIFVVGVHGGLGFVHWRSPTWPSTRRWTRCLCGIFTRKRAYWKEQTLTSMLIRWKNQHELHMGKDFVSLVKGIMKRLKKLVRKQYDALTHIDFRDKTHKAILRIVIVNFVILVVVELVSLMCGFEFYALVIYSIVLFLILRKFFRDVQRKYQMLLHATNELAEGNLDVVIEGDAGVFMPIQKELCRIQQGFKKAVDEEVKNERMKTELVTNVSHDLRTPLTAHELLFY